MVPGLQKASIVAHTFHSISMFFQTPFRTSFFEKPCADRGTKIRFLMPAGPRNAPLECHVRSKRRLWHALVPSSGDCRRLGSVLEPTWARFGAESVPRMHFHQFGCHFGLILEGFWTNLGWIFDDDIFQKVDEFGSMLDEFGRDLNDYSTIARKFAQTFFA